ncbi:SAM-dependent methyltransferase [Streptomyces sp. NEAU-H3]|uniref:SAM-dependent methyltransferase n=1 Tax=Streptomyces sp. NEAU-H3 TaxID=2720636 RepID=UPI00143AFB1D|nr:SAM-dependent methyltransferase [Streptomyces sp. NEAU-H3]NJA60201.1 SAM-dependent methyltransferase [Streptomyces sp. NEAU-H3]
MSEAAPNTPSPYIDTTRPHPARMYDWFLGGKDNYPVDEEMGRKVLAIEPNVPVLARMNREFMRRATRWLASQGLRQFLDIGTGIPTEPNLHQVAQGVARDARVVYCDNDPIVLAHAEALLRSTPEGAVDYVQADVRDSEAIVERASKSLDFSKPVALSLIALLHFVGDRNADGGAGAHEIVSGLVDRLAPGSYLVLSHVTADFQPEKAEQVGSLYRSGTASLHPRPRAEFEKFFTGLEFVGPGIVSEGEWHPELGEPVPGEEDVIKAGYSAVARKP